ncbi:LLM class flavin-dependent oxidoreductase [Streptomyces radicis]|uniref:LLM class flavin-dependent oxidoreductase n=1 Tax=Streptomyces radicis TaxID=1750517 RepID=A0A3A9WFC9_9ACTN|nr:LLM class flavin-dependent oxidoreductase [Streptomyces radicis]RKN04777.1 LLM class flavin-dependent oxidoreductase [Streptomyces radicis]RKN15983.1 LLM class flavin-dependent oxidoreductase [Streptomyces radicis]
MTLRLSTALDEPGGAADAWGTPRPADHWLALVRRAERAGLDFVTLGDSFAPPSPGGGRLDAVAVLASVAPNTERIGLVPTVTTTHTEPFHTASSIATLDFVSRGRAGWLVDVSTGLDEALAFGRRDPAPPGELWSEAADAAEVAARLWDSWEDDAEIRDVATGRFIDREKLHYIDFEGRAFSVRGPSIVPRPPQGRPPVVVALDERAPGERWELAARHADIVLLTAASPPAVQLARSALDGRVAAAGRDPGAVRLLVAVAIDLAGGGSGGESGDGGGPLRFSGTPESLAVLLADWYAATQADGFHLLPTAPEADLAAVADALVPLLRRRGLLRAGYRGRTLRDHLGLTRPASRYATEVPQ